MSQLVVKKRPRKAVERSYPPGTLSHRALARQKAKFNRVVEAMCDGVLSRRARAITQLEELWYGTPPPSPEHGGGQPAMAVQPGILKFMREEWADGERVEDSIVKTTCEAIKEAAKNAGKPIPKGLSASTLKRKYMPWVKGTQRKRKKRGLAIRLWEVRSSWDQLRLPVPKKVGNRKA
jgi:hypothetical protein